MDDFERFTGKPRRRLERVSIEVHRRGHRVRKSIGLNSIADVEELVRRISRKRPPGMAPALVEPPRGPLPMQGGAAAPLEFDD
jgi:hypothetical protein